MMPEGAITSYSPASTTSPSSHHKVTSKERKVNMPKMKEQKDGSVGP